MDVRTEDVGTVKDIKGAIRRPGSSPPKLQAGRSKNSEGLGKRYLDFRNNKIGLSIAEQRRDAISDGSTETRVQPGS